VHSGGVTSKPHLSGGKIVEIKHVFPGLASPQDNETAVAEYCAATTLKGEMLIELKALGVTVHTRPLYWCTRKMIEALAANSDVQMDIAARLAPSGH
jgi:hypothetical protein